MHECDFRPNTTFCLGSFKYGHFIITVSACFSRVNRGSSLVAAEREKSCVFLCAGSLETLDRWSRTEPHFQRSSNPKVYIVQVGAGLFLGNYRSSFRKWFSQRGVIREAVSFERIVSHILICIIISLCGFDQLSRCSSTIRHLYFLLTPCHVRTYTATSTCATTLHCYDHACSLLQLAKHNCLFCCWFL